MYSLCLFATFIKSKIMTTIFKKIIKKKKENKYSSKCPKAPVQECLRLGLVTYSPAGDGMIVIRVWMVSCLMGEKYEAFTPRHEL